MELKQTSIFGGYEVLKVGAKAVTRKKQTKLNSKNKILKIKIKILYDLYEQLFKKFNISFLEQREIIVKGGIVIYPDERQAEPIESIDLKIEDIDKRIELTKNAIQEQELPKQLQFDFMEEYKCKENK